MISPKKEEETNCEIILCNNNVINIPSFGVKYLEIYIQNKQNEQERVIVHKIIQANIIGTKINYYFCLFIEKFNQNIIVNNIK